MAAPQMAGHAEREAGGKDRRGSAPGVVMWGQGLAAASRDGQWSPVPALASKGGDRLRAAGHLLEV